VGDWLAQNGEDRIIAAYLAEHHPTLVGRVLDIGAHDGWSLSNTARLLERGWGGTLVEASPRPLAALLDRWGHRKDIGIVGAVITHAPPAGLGDWFDDAGAACHGGEAFLGTTERANVRKWEGATKFRHMLVMACPLAMLLDNCGGPYDVISIDVEGTSVALLQAIPPRIVNRAKVVVVEHDDMHAEIAQWCATYGYRVLECNAENVIAVRA